MIIKKIWVSYERGVGLEGFSNNVKFGEGLNADLEDRDNPLEAAATLFALCKHSVRLQTLAVTKGARIAFEQVVTSLPEEYREAFQEMLEDANIDLIMGGGHAKTQKTEGEPAKVDGDRATEEGGAKD